jgi:hypothetical protein
LAACAARALGLRFGLGLEGRLRLPNPLKPALAPPQLLRHLVPTAIRPVLRVLRGVNLGRPAKPLRDLGLDPRFVPAQPIVTHRFVLTRVRPDFRSIHRDVLQLDQLRLLAQRDHLLEQPAQRREVPSAKLADRPEVRDIAGRQHAKGDVLTAPAASIRAAAVNPSIDHVLRADSKMTGGLFRLVGPDGLDPTSIRAGHAGQSPHSIFALRRIRQAWREAPLLDIG